MPRGTWAWMPAARSIFSSCRWPRWSHATLCPVEDLAHRRQELLDADRLALEAVEPSGHDALCVLGHHRGRDGDDRGGACLGIGPQLLQGFDAADAGQLDVHQDERRMSLVREMHALFPGLGLDGLV